MSLPISRRLFLKLASTAGTSALTGCLPTRHLVPYVVPQDDVIPGMPTFYSTACNECPAGCGVVARIREGRAIKLEGNPKDPIGQGALCARGQAALQGLYNPDRLKKPMVRGEDGKYASCSWPQALNLLARRIRAVATTEPGRIAIIAPWSGPTTEAIIGQLSVPETRRVIYQPLGDIAAHEAVRKLFKRDDLPVYRLDAAEVMVSFGADFLETWRSPVELSRQYARFRTPKGKGQAAQMGLSYYVGPRESLSAAKCDRWLSCRPATERAVALAMLRVVAQGNLVRGNLIDRQELLRLTARFDSATAARLSGLDEQTIVRIAHDFAQADGAVALADGNDADLHMAAMALNAATANLSRTELFLQGTINPPPSSPVEIKQLISEMEHGDIDLLLIVNANPRFTFAPGLNFDRALARVPFSIWCGTVADETAAAVSLALPIHHPLESWSDLQPRAGLFVLGQPVMAPVTDSRPLDDLLLFVGHSAAHKQPLFSDAGAARIATWQAIYRQQGGGNDFDDLWTQVRRDGGLFTATPVAKVRPDCTGWTPKPARESASALELVTFAHPYFYDGRGADKPWLQELPEPMTQAVWDPWVALHPNTAQKLGLKKNDVAEISTAHGAIDALVHIDPHLWPQAVAIPIGQGHTSYGRYANGRGGNTWQLLAANSRVEPVNVRPTSRTGKLITAQYTADMMDREIVEVIDYAQLRQGHKPPPKEPLPPRPWEMYAKRTYPEHQWGMTIDLNSCTGCSACITACYAENNLPVVGKAGVERGRIMSWIRLERYFPRRADAPQIYTMPMLCQQCDHAPCEPVCPVYAAYHTDEGLNGQIYNRCVGTRYCENNCPYKVRRFNWFNPVWESPLHLQLNPDVTVRGMGVMEKCTFCVQRIRAGEVAATVQDRPLRDSEIVPACAQTCPAEAIVFGDMKNPDSAVMKRRQSNSIRAYAALESLNTVPSITYLRTVYRSPEALR